MVFKKSQNVSGSKIPGFSKKNWHNFKKYGGGCLPDMGPYAAAVFRIFIAKNIGKVNFFSACRENQNGVNTNFNVEIVAGKKSFSGYFSHNGKYKNTITLFTREKNVTINRSFSPPNRAWRSKSLKYQNSQELCDCFIVLLRLLATGTP